MTEETEEKILKSATKLLAETLSADTVVVLAERGDLKMMQVIGGRFAGHSLILKSAAQIAIMLEEKLTKEEENK